MVTLRKEIRWRWSDSISRVGDVGTERWMGVLSQWLVAKIKGAHQFCRKYTLASKLGSDTHKQSRLFNTDRQVARIRFCTPAACSSVYSSISSSFSGKREITKAAAYAQSAHCRPVDTLHGAPNVVVFPLDSFARSWLECSSVFPSWDTHYSSTSCGPKGVLEAGECLGYSSCRKPSETQNFIHAHLNVR